MIEFWLVVSLSIAGGAWQIMENVKEPDRQSCLNAVAERLQKVEHADIFDHHGVKLEEEYEVFVTCSVHKSKAKGA